MKQSYNLKGERQFFESLPELKKVHGEERLSIAIIGSGIIGLSSAIWMQNAGHNVTIIDSNIPEAGRSYERASSYGNACTMAYGAVLPIAMPGVLRQVPGMLIDREGPLSIFWRDLPTLMPWLISFLKSSTPKEVDRIVGVLGILMRYAEAGNSFLIDSAGAQDLLVRNSCLYLYRNERQFSLAEPDIKLRQREGVNMQVLSAEAIREREPNLAPFYHKGLLFSDAYHVDNPHKLALRLFESFKKSGGSFIRSDVDRISSTNAGMELAFSNNKKLFDRAIIAAGSWSKSLARMVGDNIRLDTERGYHVFFPSSERLLSAPTCYPDTGFYLTPLSNGIRAAGTVELGGLDRPTRTVRTDVISRRAKRLLPKLGEPDSTWLGFRPSMPDSLPVIGLSPTDSRVAYAFGHGHIGLTLSGITGRLVCDLINGNKLPFDISDLRPDRY